MNRSILELDSRYESLRAAALDTAPIAGLTHRFYRYPARFSPVFAASAIKQFSREGDLVLDPYIRDDRWALSSDAGILEFDC